MSADGQTPIIIKKVKGHGHGHHGGAWKVAYADFVTAMMAFFLLLWLLGSTTPEEQRYISGYFKDPGGADVGKGGTSAGVIPMENAIDKPVPAGPIDGNFSFKPGQPDAQGLSSEDLRPETQSAEETQDEGKTKEKDKADKMDKSDKLENLNQSEAEKLKEQMQKMELKKLEALKDTMEEAIAEEKIFENLKDQLNIDIIDSGLRINIQDKENRPSFDIGSAHLKPYIEDVLYALAGIIETVPNRVSITGHTDAKPYGKSNQYTNWELSVDRANAARRALLEGGLKPGKIAKVEGFGDTMLFDPKLPNSAANRRIAIVVLKKSADEAMIKQASPSASAVNTLPPEWSREKSIVDEVKWESARGDGEEFK